MKSNIAAVFMFVQMFYKPIFGFENLIRYGTVMQSSSYRNAHGTFDVNRTIDGNKNQSWHGFSCGHTDDGHTSAWWRLDIGQLATIHRVVIYYRSDKADRLNGFYIYVSETFDPAHPNFGKECFHDVDDGPPNITQNITCNMVGKYVVIYNERRSPDAFLELCEVEVFGCSLKKYGNNCEKSCSTHCTNETCDVVTGACTCKSGYTGKLCRRVCNNGTYGMGCSKNCSNCVNESCNKFDGTCTIIDLCKPGYLGPKCDQVCTKGTYGMNCTGNCTTCESEDCNLVDGICWNGCKPGWKDPMCSKVCTKGNFGLNCTHNCSNCESDNCDPVDGTCRDGCKAGWKDSMCNTVCTKGTYGINCTGNCTTCESEDCNPVDGICWNGCKPGWKDPMCSKACEKGTYGMGCNKTCSNCVNESCDQFNGTCTTIACKPGYLGLKCDQVCHEHRFGNDCQESCHCINDTACSNINGHCVKGFCDRGWSGFSCSQNCPKGTYGFDCVMNCIGCFDDMCEAEFGNCTKYGCKPGFQGHKCDMQDNTKDVKSPALGAGVGVGLVLLLVIAVLIFRRRRRDRDKHKTGTDCRHSDSSYIVDARNPLDQCLKNRTCEEKEYVNVEKRQHLVNDNNAFYHEDQTENVYANESNGDVSQYLISTNDLAVEVERKKKSNDYNVEFAMLPVGSQYYSHNEAIKEENKQKNRFLTTFAYDHSRVKLVDSVSTDYINANYIKSYSNDRAYIATQGPKKSTLNDFWQMIWQENVGKIVMVTQLKEGEKKKCEQYWPQSTRESLVTGNWILRMTIERKQTVYTYRCVEVTNKVFQVKEVRKIHHFHFTQWPDHGVPDKTNLVYFQRKVKSTTTELTGPLVVHCSAGIGRTGTYIALDALYDNGRATGFINLMEFTDMMRKDRMNMIQTVDQYIIVHDALVEAFFVEDTAIPSKSFFETLELNLSKMKGKNKNIFHVEYKKLLELKAKHDTNKFQAGKRRENIAKNVAQTILPHDDFRPYLMSFGRSRNDYINAVIIPSFVQGKKFIVTQYPLNETVGDFWSLVYDQDCRTIVMLEGKPRDVVVFPENAGQESSFDNFVMSKISHDQSPDKIYLELKHKDHDDDIRNLTIYITDGWSGCTTIIPNSEKPVTDFTRTIYNDVGRTKSQVLVLCRDGCTYCGVFVTLSLAMEEIEMNEEVDIFQIARRIQARRPEFLTNAEQYEFCYRCIKEYLRSESLYANM